MESYPRNGKIRTDASFRETVCHGSEEYPFQYYQEDIWQYDFHCIDWHWHDEVELVFVEKGTAEVFVGSDRHILGREMGVFINSQTVHKFEATESTLIPNIVFSPSLLAREDGLLYQKYIHPVLASPIKCLVFSANDPGQGEIADVLRAVFAIQEGALCEIKTVALLLHLWGILYEKIGGAGNPFVPQPSARTQAQLQIMMQYIHKNYPCQISLDNIADTVSLSKSSVLQIFSQNIHTSPIGYLVNYRLKRAAKRLASTQDSISIIARDSGFENVGYFCRKFKEVFHMTPSTYRKKCGMNPMTEKI